MAPKRHGKANIQASKPDLPPFLQRMKEQIVANEDKDRQQRGERMRKMRTNRDNDEFDDDPTVIKIAENDITEEEFKRIKYDLENNYKTEENIRPKSNPVDLDVDTLIQSRDMSINPSCSNDNETRQRIESSIKRNSTESNKKTLSYSSDEEE